jgi:hypothetical protein
LKHAEPDAMQGYRFSSDRRLPERDLRELADLLALQIHTSLGPRVYLLPRADIYQLICPYIDDLTAEDQQDLAWIIWHLFQDASELDPPVI